jgi:hypothetical protein
VGGAGGAGGAGGGGGAVTIGDPCGASLDCDDGLFCNGVELCVSGTCVGAPLGPCDSQSPCIVDTCNEALGTCSHQVLAGAVDADGDGFIALGCAGGNDCDDSPATGAGINPAAPELCDGLDNDCDGLVDEGTLRPRTPVGSAAAFAGGLRVSPFGASDWLWLALDDGGSYLSTYLSSGGGTWAAQLGDFDQALHLTGPEGGLVLGSAWADVSAIPLDGAALPAASAAFVDHNVSTFTGAYTGARYLVAYRAGSDDRYLLIEPDGSILDAPHLLNGGQGVSAVKGKVGVAADGAGTALVAYVDPSDVLRADVLRPNAGNFDVAATVDLPASSYEDFVLLGTAAGFFLVTDLDVVHFSIGAQNQIEDVTVPPLPAPLPWTNDFDAASDGDDGLLVAYPGTNNYDVDAMFTRVGSQNPPELMVNLLQASSTGCGGAVRAAGWAGRVAIACVNAGKWRGLACPP